MYGGCVLLDHGFLGKFILKQLDYSLSFSTSDSRKLGFVV